MGPPGPVSDFRLSLTGGFLEFAATRGDAISASTITTR